MLAVNYEHKTPIGLKTFGNMGTNISVELRMADSVVQNDDLATPDIMNGSNFINMANIHLDSSRSNETETTKDDKILVWFGEYPVDSERLAIGILFTGMLFLFSIVIHVWRKDVKEKRKFKAYKSAQQDLPPTYSELMSRKNPPAYKESLMQVTKIINIMIGITLLYEICIFLFWT